MSVGGNARACLIAVLCATSTVFDVAQCQSSVIEPWRLHPSAVVLGETLHIMGGWTSENKAIAGSTWTSEQRTVALPLNSRWDLAAMRPSDTTGFTATERLAVWPGLDNQTILSWGGMDIPTRIWGKLPVDNKSFAAEPRLRVFRPESRGSSRGSWTSASSTPPTDSESAQRIHRTRFGAWTSCNGFGFHMGGQVRVDTDSTYPDVGQNKQAFPPGLVIYDMKRNQWTNRTATGFGTAGYEGTYMHGQAVCLPALGTKGQGLVVFIGGYHCSTDSSKAGASCEPRDGSGKEVDMDKITFYDIGTGKFHSQRTTGPSPTPRERHCAVAAKADGTHAHEIVVFGGRRQSPAETFVLTVPGFRWFRAADAAGTRVARADHSCAVLGAAGARQMVAVGGVDETDLEALQHPDPWVLSKHMRILDMTELKWDGTYRPDAPRYQQPGPVKEWYSKAKNLDAIKWDSADTQALFATAINDIKASTSSTSVPETAPAPEAEPSGPPVGVIVGATIGILAAGWLLATCLWCFCRHKSWPQQQSPILGQHATRTTKTQPSAAPQEMPAPPPELYEESYATRRPQELRDPRPPQELYGGPKWR
ncbi:hypothetical protein RB598_009002 [Gaeumannomyces tritici]